MAEMVYVETGAKKVFACAVDWPGWCRSGKTEDDALDALAAYAERYATAVGVRIGTTLEVVERLAGSGSTDFGVPGSVPALDLRPTSAADARRLAGLVQAAWDALDRAAASAPPTLRKGPRGGGRDRDAIVAHVVDAEAAYGPRIGVRGAAGDPALRAGILAVIGAPSDGQRIGPKGWPVRYAARRVAWHALDHAWEIEDKSEV